MEKGKREDLLNDRFAKYKIHQLDWFDVESRIKMICGDMLRPVAEIASSSKTTLEKECSRIEKCLIDTDKLNNAVFYNKRRTKNIFHVVLDDITELKA